jgi:hypothetical protein
MISILLALPVLGLAFMLQTGIVSRINLLSGSADLVMAILVTWALQEKVKSAWYWAVAAGLMAGFISGLPWYIPLAGYLLVVGIARLVHRRVWQAPLLATFVVMFLGTVGMQLLSAGYLLVVGAPFQIGDAIGLIIIPCTMLNLLLVIPTHYVIRDLAQWIYPSEVKL